MGNTPQEIGDADRRPSRERDADGSKSRSRRDGVKRDDPYRPGGNGSGKGHDGPAKGAQAPPRVDHKAVRTNARPGVRRQPRRGRKRSAPDPAVGCARRRSGVPAGDPFETWCGERRQAAGPRREDAADARPRPGRRSPAPRAGTRRGSSRTPRAADREHAAGARRAAPSRRDREARDPDRRWARRALLTASSRTVVHGRQDEHEVHADGVSRAAGCGRRRACREPRRHRAAASS